MSTPDQASETATRSRRRDALAAVVATLVGIFVFHEKLTPLSALGCVCVLSAVVLLNLKRRQKAN